jgi:hypothetical protein
MDLIVTPTHGYGLFRRFLFGSATLKVLHDAACPVWTASTPNRSQLFGTSRFATSFVRSM